MKKKEILIFIGLLLMTCVGLFVHGYIIKKHEEVRISRASLHNPPHSVGSSCLSGGETIAILKKYLDNTDHWVYDVMMLDDESIPVHIGVPHSSIKYCEE